MTSIARLIPDSARNVLLLGSDDVVQADDTCQALATGDTPGRTRVLTISYHHDAAEYRDRWMRTVGTPPAQMVVIQAQNQGVRDEQSQSDDTVVISESPDDLTWLGIHTNEYLTRWHDHDPVAVCLDSLSVLLQYANVERAYKFLHVLSGRVERAEAVAHYHIDPAIHDDQVVNSLKQLCDTTVRYDSETAEWEVRSR